MSRGNIDRLEDDLGVSQKGEEMKEAMEMIGSKIDELIAERERLDTSKKNERIKWAAMTEEILSLMDVKDKLYSLNWKTA